MGSALPAFIPEHSRREVDDRALARSLEACRRQLRGVSLGRAVALGADPHERSYRRLSAADGCEAWLIRWPPGACAPLHDHGDAFGVASVLSGQLHEWRKLADGAEGERGWLSGAAIALPLAVRHEVRNLTPRTAYSIHVYAPRLDHMTFYARTQRGELRPLRREDAADWSRA